MSATVWACRSKPPLYRLSLKNLPIKTTQHYFGSGYHPNQTQLDSTKPNKKNTFSFLERRENIKKKKKKLEPTNVDSLHLRKWRQIAALPAMHAKPVLINQPMLKVQNCFLFDEESTVATLILCHLHVDYPLIFLTLELVD